MAVNQRLFQPFGVGPFWIHPSQDPDVPASNNAMSLCIDPGPVFGSGTHATTRGCLEAIARLDLPTSTRAIDVGCGSGILAIAMAKLWRSQVLGSDNDPEAIAVARDNATLNAVGELCSFHVADGLESPALSAVTFDLIVANLLAQSLIDLASPFAAAAAPAATLLLAGLLTEQEHDVRAAYARCGFVASDRIVRASGGADWPTIVLRRGHG